jgi:hypothetical protein
MASVAVRPNTRLVEGTLSTGDLALLSQWIDLHRDAILKYRDGEIDTKDAMDALQRLD